MGAGGKKKVEVEGQRLAAHRCPSPHRPIAALAATIRHPRPSLSPFRNPSIPNLCLVVHITEANKILSPTCRNK